MFEFLIYEVKVAVMLTVFYLCYRLLLSSEKLHRLNRIVLVSSVLISFALPICRLTIHRTTDAPDYLLTDMSNFMAADAATPAGIQELPGHPWWQIALCALYCAGAVAVLANVLISALRVLKLVKTGTARQFDGREIIVIDSNVAPFSWMKWIVMSESDYESGNRHIVEHEKAHLALGHSWEVLFVNVFSALQWFNPAIWLLKRDLRDIHEYEADDMVLRKGANIKEYQYSLIRKAVSASGYSITNSFNHSILKKRITMMSKSKSSAFRGLKALYVLPLVCLGLAMSAKTVYESAGKDNEIISCDETSVGILDEVIVVRYGVTGIAPDSILKGHNVYRIERSVDECPWNELDSKPVCSENFTYWMTMRLTYPAGCNYEGTVKVTFLVDLDGNVRNVEIAEGVCKELDDEVANLVKKSPQWRPAVKDGVPVTTRVLLPVIFQTRIKS